MRTFPDDTYCFEDNWPWLGDYDMNDVGIVSRIDRMMSKDGGKVSALTINWELRAAGTTYDIAGAVQMDKVQTSDVAGVVSSHEGFGSGAFASRGLDADSPCAVIPFFNRTEELLSASNTWKGQPAAAIRKHTTTVTFSQPVDIASVLDSEMNFFIAPKQRTSEIHMPGYAPTASGIIGKGSFLPSDPYKFFVTEGEQTKNTNDAPDDIEATTLVKAGTQAPDFRVEMFDGTTFTLGSLRGKVVLLNFWATWCGPCREELSRVQKDIIDRFKGNEDFVFLPVSRGETRETVAAFREKMGYTFPMGLDPEQKIYRLYASNYIPRNFLIGKDGKVISATIGYEAPEFDELILLIERQLNSAN